MILMELHRKVNGYICPVATYTGLPWAITVLTYEDLQASIAEYEVKRE